MLKSGCVNRGLFRETEHKQLAKSFEIDLAMNSRYYRDQVEQAISGAEGMANNLPLSSLLDFIFPIPPPKKAGEIAAHLRKNLRELQTARTRLEREIELLREYRTRLVADVVTGKLDVRPAARQLSAESLALEPAPVADSLDETGDLGETQTEET